MFVCYIYTNDSISDVSQIKVELFVNKSIFISTDVLPECAVEERHGERVDGKDNNDEIDEDSKKSQSKMTRRCAKKFCEQ